MVEGWKAARSGLSGEGSFATLLSAMGALLPTGMMDEEGLGVVVVVDVVVVGCEGHDRGQRACRDVIVGDGSIATDRYDGWGDLVVVVVVVVVG